LENLLVSTCIKRRIRGMAKKDYRRDEHKNSSSSFNFAPTTVWWWAFIRTEDYGQKAAIKKQGRFRPCHVRNVTPTPIISD
jgi:hypothetical protein